MEMITLISLLCCVMWYIIDRAKTLWMNLAFGKYITIAVSAVFGFGFAFGYGLDIIFALDAWPQVTTQGTVITALVFMCGSSAFAEIMEKIKGKTKNIISE